jgi:hypothetical protein
MLEEGASVERCASSCRDGTAAAAVAAKRKLRLVGMCGYCNEAAFILSGKIAKDADAEPLHRNVMERPWQGESVRSKAAWLG